MKEKNEILDTKLNRSLAKRQINVLIYKTMFYLLLVVSILEFILIFVLIKRQTVEIPYVIEIQKDGSAKYIDNASSSLSDFSPSVQTTLKVLENYIISLRSVSFEASIQEDRIKKVYAFSTEDALKSAKKYLEEKPPFERALKERVEVSVYAATPLYKTDSSLYQLDFNEKTYTLGGELKDETNYRAIISTKIFKVRTKSLQEENPLGIYLTRLEISKIKDGYVIYEN